MTPAVPSYTGPQRFAPNLPSVIELMQVEDFEATMQWVIGVRNLGLTATAQAFTGPSRIEVDVPHGGTPAVTLSPCSPAERRAQGRALSIGSIATLGGPSVGSQNVST